MPEQLSIEGAPADLTPPRHMAHLAEPSDVQDNCSRSFRIPIPSWSRTSRAIWARVSERLRPIDVCNHSCCHATSIRRKAKHDRIGRLQRPQDPGFHEEDALAKPGERYDRQTPKPQQLIATSSAIEVGNDNPAHDS
jgi:hypothetical protein